MTPGARVQAAIEVLDKVLDGAAAEQALTGWARNARYAGSKDRAAVRDHVFQALRCKRSYAALGGAETGRGLMLGLVRAVGVRPEDVFNGKGYAPAPLKVDEQAAGDAPTGPASHDLPDWLWPRFETALGSDGAAEAALHMQRRGPVSLRVNLRKSDAAKALEPLQQDGVEAVSLPNVATALHVVEGARRIAQSAAYLNGVVELQDASSQAAMLSLPVPNGARVLDYCAGGGGKVLALAAIHDGTWFAHDVNSARVKDLPARAKRADVSVTILQTDEIVSHAPFDVVLCDVPCSGSGTWRRTPDAKWHLTPDHLRAYQQMQADILRKTSRMVRPGGLLAYSTCSVLQEENEGQIQNFKLDHPDWRLVVQQRWPVSTSGDGFFLAALEAPV